MSWAPLFSNLAFVISVVLLTGGHAACFSAQLNLGWRFQPDASAADVGSRDVDDSNWAIVSLPHSEVLFSANCSGFGKSGRGSGVYRRRFVLSSIDSTRRTILEFRGAMQSTTLWVNGNRVGVYTNGGFDSFGFDITPFVFEGTNVIAVQVDNRTNPSIPPDGKWADYLLFGGLYRDVILHSVGQVHLTFPWKDQIGGVRITQSGDDPPNVVIQVQATAKNDSNIDQRISLEAEIQNKNGESVTSTSDDLKIEAGHKESFQIKSPRLMNPHLWSPDDPYLYTIITRLREGSKILDQRTNRWGFRWCKFDRSHGFFLNGKPLKLVGVNRHQTWPFIGNAVPSGLQRRDAEQMKAMGINWVRLSHYPQDPRFLDALDELGIMALEEPATWMESGPEAWMKNLEVSFRNMIRRDRNHPCIIVWGTCINHQGANPVLVAAAKEEDPTRDRAQDTVKTPMNFAPRVVSGEGALAIEHTGHTFPAARGERLRVYRVTDDGNGRVETNINREYDLARKHWEQVNAAYQRADNSGLAVWCMYDYNTFHNTDEQGMTWHGVCDLFRLPKFSYWWYTSELTTNPMAYVVRIDATRAAVFSNCEQVRLSEDDGNGYRRAATHSPDTGFVTNEGERIKYALHHPPFHFMVSSNAQALKAEGLVRGKVLATYEWKQFGSPVRLQLEADRSAITADGSDLSRIIVTAVDTNGTPVDTCNALVAFSITGLGQLIGENPTRLRAGKMIILAQSGYVPDTLSIKAESSGLISAEVSVKTEPVGSDVDIPPDLTLKQPTRRFLVTDLPLTHSRSHPAPPLKDK
jgi:beta-galactosidase